LSIVIVCGSVRAVDPKQGGGLTALRISDGSKVWYARPAACSDAGVSPGQSGAVSAVPGAVFSGSLDGHLRAFASEDGAYSGMPGNVLLAFAPDDY
jgi:hypothetical protein